MFRLIDPRTYRRVVLTALTLLLFSLVSIPAANSAVAQETPAPTVGEIAFESYDCDTGELRFDVPVAGLPHSPRAFGQILWYAAPTYDQGTVDGPAPFWDFNPPPAISPYTGTLSLIYSVPPTNFAGGTVTSIFVSVLVLDADAKTTDSTEATFPVDCGDSNPDLVQQLIATLIAILKSILNEQ
jgi:hypothetical protein